MNAESQSRRHAYPQCRIFRLHNNFFYVTPSCCVFVIIKVLY